VYNNRVLRRMFRPRRDDDTEEWRKLHNEELNDLYSSPNIFRVIKERRMICAGHVARMGKGQTYTVFWWGNVVERGHLEDSGVDGRIILRWILRKCDVGMNWIDLAQDSDRWRAFVYAVMNLRVS
jgi:hypothetical protein